MVLLPTLLQGLSSTISQTSSGCMSYWSFGYPASTFGACINSFLFRLAGFCCKHLFELRVRSPEPKNLAPLQGLIPFYSNQHALLPKSPCNCEFERFGCKTLPVHALIPFQSQDNRTLLWHRRFQVLTRVNWSKCFRHLSISKIAPALALGSVPANTKCDFLAIGTGLVHAQGQGFPTGAFELAIIGWFGLNRTELVHALAQGFDTLAAFCGFGVFL